MVDNRVHACLYFIQPTGHSCVFLFFSCPPFPCSPLLLAFPCLLPRSSLSLTPDGKWKKLTHWLGLELGRLKPIDIEFMRRLHLRVNLIPVIAKSDTLTDEEISAFKARVRCLISFLLSFSSPPLSVCPGALD